MEADAEEDESTDDEREDGGVEGCGDAQGVASLDDPLEDGVPRNAAGEEGWADTAGDVATDAVTFEDGSADALADDDVEATDSARGDEGATDAVTFEDG